MSHGVQNRSTAISMQGNWGLDALRIGIVRITYQINAGYWSLIPAKRG
jgi:hypothetical protein